jgi:GT2 family glycosyltransferase
MNSPDISIVTCSTQDEKFNALKQNLTETFGESANIIRIDDAKSMAEGYNRGAKMASDGIVIFCHDDIEFLSQDIPEIIKADLEDLDIVGVAGTSRLIEGRWHTSGKTYTHGQVAHSAKGCDDEYQICVYGEVSNSPVVKNIQALDGLFFAVRSDIFNFVHFDETFDGFHLYDLDFSFASYLMGCRIAVDYRIHILHHSGGQYDENWHKYFNQFNKKYANLFIMKSKNVEPSIRRFEIQSKWELDEGMNNCCKKDYSAATTVIDYALDRAE